MSNDKNVVIFDLDGLLVDTETLFYHAFKMEAKKYGKLPNFYQYIEQVVSSGVDVADLIGLKGLEAKLLRKEIYNRYWILLRQKLRLRKGAIECLDSLKAFELILVTGSKREHVDFILRKFELKEHFKEIFTRDDAFPPKPDPGIFEHIVKLYKKNKWEYLVIEDSKRGITAALSVGINCIFIPNEYTKKEDFGPRVKTLNSLNEVTNKTINIIFNEIRPKIDHTLVNLYRDNIARLDQIFSIYKDIYGLESYDHEDSNIEPNAFEYATHRSFFIILAMITKDERVYFQRSFDSGHLTMILPGSGIHLGMNENILSAINRLAKKILKNAILADIAPVAFLRNIFLSQEGRKVEHIGLGVRALLLNDEIEISDYMDDIATKGSFVKSFPASEIPQPPSKNTYINVKNWLNKKNYSTYLNEIETHEKVMIRYQFHQKFVSPLINFFSYFAGKYTVKSVKEFLINKLVGSNSFIDVACGDNKIVLEALKHVPLVIANDIVADQLNNLENYHKKKLGKYPRTNTIFYTNHDCLDLPFRKDAFDVALCRNLLHHMQTANDLQNLLNNLIKVAKKVIIVEIMDPNEEGVFAKIRHRYYVKFLKDEGKNYYKKQDFQNIVSTHFGNLKSEYFVHPTLKATYMTAIIRKNTG